MGDLSQEWPVYCNVCQDVTVPSYMTYNLYVSGFVMAIVAAIGLISNILVIVVYLSPEQRVHSTSIFLAALGCSDFCLVFCAIFLYVFEAWRHHDHPLIWWVYVNCAPLMFPLSTIFQASSVYFCVAAAMDCFIIVVLPQSIHHALCTPKRAKYACMAIMAFCVVYNLPHFLEIQKVKCIDKYGELNGQICPTDIRTNEAYFTVYYTYMYTTFLAIGPLALLIFLNACIVITILTKGSPGDDFDTTSLILVVFLFIFCNFMALLVNFVEVFFNDPTMMVYLIDLSNLLVVVNGTLNFYCYFIFGAGFRATLRKRLKVFFNMLFPSKNLTEKPPKCVWSSTELGTDSLIPVD
ncbi:hypothetical protein WR25_24721 [Diploscapter pachys]|uniref:G-protein coupled receptors family 1 profile domain-containing protein n=1 Tax=Diploscapter pachys TaxID=2018661 RepID=A0A2A2L9G6_9BILA|nr:hypothetical protein WR25_24721 [Diploscapter pachys]